MSAANERMLDSFITCVTNAWQEVSGYCISQEMKRRGDDRECDLRSELRAIKKNDALSLLLCRELKTNPSILSHYYTPGQPEFDITVKRCAELLADTDIIQDSMDSIAASVLARTGFVDYTNCVEWGDIADEAFSKAHQKDISFPDGIKDPDSCLMLVRALAFLAVTTLEQKCGHWLEDTDVLRKLLGLAPAAGSKDSIELPDDTDIMKLNSALDMLGGIRQEEIASIFMLHRAGGRFLLNPGIFTQLTDYLDTGAKAVIVVNDEKTSELISRHINIGTFFYARHGELLEKWKMLSEKYENLTVMTTSLPLLHSIDSVSCTQREKNRMLIAYYSYSHPNIANYQRSLFSYSDYYYNYYIEERNYILNHSTPL